MIQKQHPVKLIRIPGLILACTVFLSSCDRKPVPQWSTAELSFEARNHYPNPYTDVEAYAVFVSQSGDSLVRPAFWDGGNKWKVRFAPPRADEEWTWTLHAAVDDPGFRNRSGKIKSVPYTGSNRLIRHGTLMMSPKKRNLVFADGTPFLLVGDTPWSLPYRATTEQVEVYAKNRKEKGYNTALLIAVQPDTKAGGPDKRNTDQGFARGFADLKDGHLNHLNPAYFQTLDSLVRILYDHEIVPVWAPLAHGYGWKGKQALGPDVSGDEYTRFVRYLLARYGSGPALWLLSLDGHGDAPGVIPAGEMLEKWDAYHQPTGLHYNPCDDFLATWAKEGDGHCFHYNKKHQDAPWLDFQWAQTGHDGEHQYHKVARMYENQPVKAVMNGEPTYEGMNEGKHGLGYWQGENAWNELLHGGTMGVVYGAVSLWQWKINPNESGWEEWTNAPYSWQQALDFEGSRYPGFVARAFEGFDFTDMEKRPDLAGNGRLLLAKEGIFYYSYLAKGGEIAIRNLPAELPCFWFDPLKGEFRSQKTAGNSDIFTAPDTLQPWVFLAGRKTKR